MNNDNNGDSDSDELALSSETLAALNEFLLNQQLKENLQKTNEIPRENWQLSQFWYSTETCVCLVDECIQVLNDNFDFPKRIACISSPSLIREFIKRPEVINGNIQLRLFEYDERFAQLYPEIFTFYDYCTPLNIPDEIKNSFDMIVVDPPFIALECLVKMAQTVKLLSKTDSKIILCTGSVIQDEAYRLLKVEMTEFKPKHENNLANDFSCFTNYKTVTL